MDFKTAVEAMQRRHATLDSLGSGVAVKPDGDPNRKRIVDEIKKFLAQKSLLKILRCLLANKFPTQGFADFDTAYPPNRCGNIPPESSLDSNLEGPQAKASVCDSRNEVVRHPINVIGNGSILGDTRLQQCLRSARLHR